MENNIILFWSKLYARRFWYQLNNALKYYKYRAIQTTMPVFIIGTPRCGSSLLESYLSALPDIKIRGEILNPWLHIGMRKNCSNKNRVIRHIRYAFYSTDALVCAVKLLNVHLERYNIFLKDLKKKFPSSKYIFIYRKKLGEQYYSLLKARITKQWFQKSEKGEDIKTMRIDIEDFNKYCLNIKEFYENQITQVEKNDKVIIAYEELKENGQNIIDNKISNFLGVKSGNISTKLKKQNLKTLSDVVVNYQDIKHLLERKLEL